MAAPSTILGELNRNGRYFRVAETVAFVTPIRPKDYGYSGDSLPEVVGGILITVPKGFITDFASVPQLGWSCVPPIGRIAFPSILHDYLYLSHPAGRKWADAVFLEAMREAGISWLHRISVWAAVRVFGRKPYDANQAFTWDA